MPSPRLAVLVLAAGRGARMKSETPKVLHPLMGRPLIEHVLNAALYLEPERLAVVTGYGADEVERSVAAFLKDGRRPCGVRPGEAEARPGDAAGGADKGDCRGGERPEVVFIRQTEQLGTGHAVATAREALADFEGRLLIMAGDVPLISPNTLEAFVMAHENLAADLSVLTVRIDDPAAYGRIIRDEAGWLERIVEFRDASDEERFVSEINSGLYVAEASALFESIGNLRDDNEQKEYYLTDVVADFRRRGLISAAVEIPTGNAFEIQGVNDRAELARVQDFLRLRINESWLRAGVAMMAPNTVHIEGRVRLAPDVTLWPGVILTGRTTVGPGAEIGPFCRLDDCLVPAGCRVPGHRSYFGRDFGREDDELQPGPA